jgi:hypothetical protein
LVGKQYLKYGVERIFLSMEYNFHDLPIILAEKIYYFPVPRRNPP